MRIVAPLCFLVLAAAGCGSSTTTIIKETTAPSVTQTVTKDQQPPTQAATMCGNTTGPNGGGTAGAIQAIGTDCTTAVPLAQHWLAAGCATNGTACPVDGFVCRTTSDAGPLLTICAAGDAVVRFGSD
jgi:hypothetical protein